MRVPSRDGPNDELRQLLVRILREELALSRPPTLEIGRHWATLLNDVFEVRLARPLGYELFFAKIGRSSGDRNGLRLEAERTRAFGALIGETGGVFNASELVAYRPEHDLLVVRSAPGQPLLAEIQRTCRWQAARVDLDRVVRWACATGRWVRHVEGLSRGIYDAAQVAETLVRSARVACDRIRAMKVFRSKSWDAAVHRSVEAVERIPTAQALTTYMAHGDLHPGNVFVTEEPDPSVTAIDLRLAEPRVEGYDALYFEHQLTYSFSRLRFRPSRISVVLNGFWSGYGRELPNRPVVHGLRAFFRLNSLVYLSTLACGARFPRRLLHMLEAAILKRDLASNAEPSASAADVGVSS